MDREINIRVSRAAAQLGVSPGYLRRLERQHRIPPARRDAFGDRVYSELDLMLLRALGIGARPPRLRRAEDVLEAQR